MSLSFSAPQPLPFLSSRRILLTRPRWQPLAGTSVAGLASCSPESCTSDVKIPRPVLPFLGRISPVRHHPDAWCCLFAGRGTPAGLAAVAGASQRRPAVPAARQDEADQTGRRAPSRNRAVQLAASAVPIRGVLPACAQRELTDLVAARGVGGADPACNRRSSRSRRCRSDVAGGRRCRPGRSGVRDLGLASRFSRPAPD